MLNRFFSLMLAAGDGIAPGWYQPVVYAVLGLIVAISVAVVVLVLAQPSQENGLGALSGSAETYFEKNKAKRGEQRMKKLTVILAIVLAVLCVLFAVLQLISF